MATERGPSLHPEQKDETAGGPGWWSCADMRHWVASATLCWVGRSSDGAVLARLGRRRSWRERSGAGSSGDCGGVSSSTGENGVRFRGRSTSGELGGGGFVTSFGSPAAATAGSHVSVEAASPWVFIVQLEATVVELLATLGEGVRVVLTA